MSDLISRQTAIKTIDDLPNCYNGYSDTYDKAYIIGVLEELPTIDPVKHGKWKNKQMLDEELNPTIAFRHRCSECGFEICTTDETIWWHFCPNCGAKVDGGEG